MSAQPATSRQSYRFRAAANPYVQARVDEISKNHVALTENIMKKVLQNCYRNNRFVLNDEKVRSLEAKITRSRMGCRQINAQKRLLSNLKPKPSYVLPPTKVARLPIRRQSQVGRPSGLPVATRIRQLQASAQQQPISSAPRSQRFSLPPAPAPVPQQMKYSIPKTSRKPPTSASILPKATTSGTSIHSRPHKARPGTAKPRASKPVPISRAQIPLAIQEEVDEPSRAQEQIPLPTSYQPSRSFAAEPTQASTSTPIKSIIIPSKTQPTYQMNLPSTSRNSPNKKITSDRNLSQEEVNDISEIIENVSERAGITNADVNVLTKHVSMRMPIKPGKYDIFKIINKSI